MYFQIEARLKKPIYFISGLGADERVFEYLQIAGYEPRFIKWLSPKTKESLQDYATRLRQQIAVENPVILGVSFGGMMAIEISKQIDCQKIILISSVKSREELPITYRLLGCLNLHKLAPTSVLKKANFLTYWFFGTSTASEKTLLKSILENTDKDFLRWAINSIVKWNNKNADNRIIHIHGLKDKILPVSNITHLNFKIKDGGHLMIYNKAQNINSILQAVLN